MYIYLFDAWNDFVVRISANKLKDSSGKEITISKNGFFQTRAIL